MVRLSNVAAVVITSIGAASAVGAQDLKPYLGEGLWSSEEGVLHSEVEAGHSARLFPSATAAEDRLIEAEVRMAASGRAIFGLILRAQDDGSCLAMRFHDWTGALELLQFHKGQPRQVGEASEKVSFRPIRWHHMKAAVVGDVVLGKFWPVGAEEPDWQLRAYLVDAQGTGVGVITMDDSTIEYRGVTISSGKALKELRQSTQRDKTAYVERIKNVMTLEIKPTPLVLRSDEGPMRRVDLRVVTGGRPAPIGGELTVSFGPVHRTETVRTSDLIRGAKYLLLPEPDEPTELQITLATSLGKTLEGRTTIAPVRPWTFYMTEHTHYDIGFTGPQAEVIDQLSRDMETVQPFVQQTADWPASCRFKWTVEVSGLLKNYIERHSRQEIEQLIDLVRQGSVEICGYYLNMPTELVGHEELIRGLYYTQQVRDRYGIQIDTAMIDDVPGYTWALPEVFVEAGIPRVSFRANSIRGQFLWYRPGAVPRPCYWEGPDGSRLFMWYTDSYREGNFWRNPGLQEDRFLEVIQRNEEIGCTVDHIQLRMGGDNLAPDLDVSLNARAWGKKYLWPEVRVSTNREFLETLEDKYGDQCPIVRGDIPSWWAEGPGSSAYETGINRLVHDQLVGVEALWTIACLADTNRQYPKPAIAAAYDNMIHFDEHVWGASEAVSRPRDESTIFQWNFKARYAHTAKNLADDLEHHALRILSESVPSPKGNSIAVWNTLAWKRSDVVEISLVEQQLGWHGPAKQGRGLIDTRSGTPVNVQLSSDGKKAWFVAKDVPAMGYAVFTFEPTENTLQENTDKPGVLENDHYRLVVSPESGGWSSWYDKQLDRELIDRSATYRGNQPIYETPIGDRDTINKKEPVQFKRTAATAGRLIAQSTGKVFSEMTFETGLPRCPRIQQTVRVYHDLKVVDVINTVVKDEVFEPEAVYFAFPFDVPKPEFHVQIADAIMQPGKDQLPLTCYDFYSIQQWADVSGDGFGVILAPLEAPLVTISDMNVYKWADKLTFDKGHVYSFALNNYWFTNFKAGQFGTIPFRYRLTSYKGDYDPIRATQFAWQPFHPLKSVWLKPNTSPEHALPKSLIELEGDEVIVSCIKTAEKGQDVIIRLLEMRGQPASCKLKLTLPNNRPIVEAHTADVVERPKKTLPVDDGAIEIQLRPNEVYTLRMVPRTF